MKDIILVIVIALAMSFIEPVKASEQVWKVETVTCTGNVFSSTYSSYNNAMLYVVNLPYTNICTREITLWRIK